MSEVDLKRFDIVSGQIQNVYEFDDGRWEQDRIEPDETYTLSGADVLHTELDDGRMETTLYRDLDGSGTYHEMSTSYSLPGQTSTTVLPDAADQSLARLYMAVFDRSPDEGGFRSWEKHMDLGMSLNEVAVGFLASEEFSMRYGALDDASFVDQLYLNVLDRTADAAGKQSWLELLDSQTLSRHEVVTGFSESAEFVALSGDSVNAFLHVVGQPGVVDAMI